MCFVFLQEGNIQSVGYNVAKIKETDQIKFLLKAKNSISVGRIEIWTGLKNHNNESKNSENLLVNTPRDF